VLVCGPNPAANYGAKGNPQRVADFESKHDNHIILRIALVITNQYQNQYHVPMHMCYHHIALLHSGDYTGIAVGINETTSGQDCCTAKKCHVTRRIQKQSKAHVLRVMGDAIQCLSGGSPIEYHNTQNSNVIHINTLAVCT